MAVNANAWTRAQCGDLRRDIAADAMALQIPTCGTQQREHHFDEPADGIDVRGVPKAADEQQVSA